MRNLLPLLVFALLVNGCASQKMASGVDLDALDTQVRPQDDFYHYVAGSWLRNTEIPADKSSTGHFSRLADEVDADIRTIIESTAAAGESGRSAQELQIAQLYQSFQDVDRINAGGLKPLRADFARIDKLTNHGDLTAYFSHCDLGQLNCPWQAFVAEDFDNPTVSKVFLAQSGLGLPNRDYYFDESDKGRETVAAYRKYLVAMFGKLGHADPARAADSTLALEQQLAQHQRGPVENRQFDKWYNPHDRAQLAQRLPAIDWQAYLAATGISDQQVLIVAQPDYLSSLAEIIPQTGMEAWRDYLQIHLLTEHASLLSQDVQDIHFDFYARTLRGTQEQKPRWQRGVKVVNGSLGDAVGQIYVAQRFSPEAKERVQELVQNLIEAYAESIENLDWMGPETRRNALDKLGKFLPKIGYPDQWKDYSALQLSSTDLVANVQQIRLWESARELDKLRKPVDRTEWSGNAQSVNAWYNPLQNTITFPAGILQPPFFDPEVDDAFNYGAIGMVIGHEIGHGFDDSGSRFNGDGALQNWWTDADREAFDKRTEKLIEQFNGYEVLPGVFVNGELTQGENIGDLAGLKIAYKAYQRSLDGREAPVIDGFSGDQRFFLGFATFFMQKSRDDYLREKVKTDPHSPTQYRVNGPVSNLPEFYDAFGVTSKDDLYRTPDERVRIW